MTFLSRRALVAIATVLDVALHARPTPVSAKVLAARHGMGPRHLESVLNALVRATILKGVRGPRGGYELARERRRITLAEIVRAAAPSSADDQDKEDSPLVASVVGPALDRATEVFLAELDRITVEALCEKARGLGISDMDVVTDFTI